MIYSSMLYILYISPFKNVLHFSSTMECFLIFLKVSFGEWKVLILMNVNFIALLWLVLFFFLLNKTLLPTF